MNTTRRFFMTAFAVLLLLGPVSTPRAQETGSADEAKAMVEKAAQLFKAEGRQKLLDELNDSKGRFIDRDLYVIAYGLDGIRLAHPYNPKLIGTSVLEAVDFDGKAYGKEIIEVAKSKGSGWVDYKFTEPTTRKLADKSLYVLKVDDIVLGCGIYKR